MSRLILLCFIAWICFPSCLEIVKAQKHQRRAIPVLTVKNDTGTAELHISKLSIDVVVAGNMATTTFDILFYNPHDKILEGELPWRIMG